MKSVRSLTFLLLAQSAAAFIAPIGRTATTASHPLFADPSTQTSSELECDFGNTVADRLSAPSLAGIYTGTMGLIGQSVAADDYELAELPPVWVPALFGVALLVGVAVLTSSLGNVMDEEASLGMQSGARAKKEIERSKSSYFGKRPR